MDSQEIKEVKEKMKREKKDLCLPCLQKPIQQVIVCNLLPH